MFSPLHYLKKVFLLHILYFILYYCIVYYIIILPE